MYYGCLQKWRISSNYATSSFSRSEMPLLKTLCNNVSIQAPKSEDN